MRMSLSPENLRGSRSENSSGKFAFILDEHGFPLRQHQFGGEKCRRCTKDSTWPIRRTCIPKRIMSHPTASDSVASSPFCRHRPPTGLRQPFRYALWRIRRASHDVCVRGDAGNLQIRHSCEHMRIQARKLSPRARGFLMSPDASFLVRQYCAPLRSSRSGHVPWLLTALDSSQPNAARNDSHLGVSAP